MFVGVNIPDLTFPATPENAVSSAQMFLSHPSTFITASDPRIFGDDEIVIRDQSTGTEYTPEDYPRAVRRRRPLMGEADRETTTSAASRSPTRPTSRTSTSTPRRAPGIDTLVGLGLTDLTVGQLVDGTTEFFTRDGDINQEDITNDAVGAWAAMDCWHFSLTDNPGVNHFELPVERGRPGPADRRRERPALGLRLGAANRYAIRVDSITQLTSHVSPPSGENACSQRQVVAVMSDQRKRTRIGRPLNVSSAMNVPMPFSKPPTTGGSSRPGVAPVEPPDRPPVGRRVERPQRDRPVGAGRQLEDVVVDVAGAVEDRPGRRRALELLPLVVAGEALLQAAVVDPPRAHVEVEVVDGRARLDRLRGDAGRGAGCHADLLGSRCSRVTAGCTGGTCHRLS